MKLMALIITSCLVFFSCEFEQIEPVHISITNEEDPLVNLQYDYETVFTEYFSGSPIRGIIDNDTTKLLYTEVLGWSILFNGGHSFRQSYIDTLTATLETLLFVLPPALHDSLQEVATIYLSQRHNNNLVAGQHYVVDRTPKKSLVHANGYPTEKVIIHELMHGWDHLYLHFAQFSVSSGLWDLYQAAKNNDLWKYDSYVVSDHTEYFAEIARYFYSSPAHLKNTDPAAFDFMYSVNKGWCTSNASFYQSSTPNLL